MAAFAAVGGEADFAAAGRLLFDCAEIFSYHGVARDFDGAVFEGHADGEGEVFFHGLGEGDAFDFVFAEFLLGAFGELEAEAGLVDAAALYLREC